MASPLIAIVGATGTGKSEFALDLAEALGGPAAAEIVGADAMQLYRGMDIGTAKVSVAERRGIRHHLVDVLDVTEEASVAAYQPAARAAIEATIDADSAAVLVGGSGLYVSAAIYDFQFPARDPEVRARLEDELASLGSAILFERLRGRDPATAARIDPANGRRVVRALEILELDETGHGATLPDEPRLQRPALVIGLSAPREILVERLDRRVETMWADGMLDEVAGLRESGIEQSVTASRAIGYAQAIAQLRGELAEAEAIAQTQALTRRYARRQVSWFKRYPGVLWLDTSATTPTERVRAAVDRLETWA